MNFAKKFLLVLSVFNISVILCDASKKESASTVSAEGLPTTSPNHLNFMQRIELMRFLKDATTSPSSCWQLYANNESKLDLLKNIISPHIYAEIFRLYNQGLKIRQEFEGKEYDARIAPILKQWQAIAHQPLSKLYDAINKQHESERKKLQEDLNELNISQPELMTVVSILGNSAEWPAFGMLLKLKDLRALLKKRTKPDVYNEIFRILHEGAQIEQKFKGKEGSANFSEAIKPILTQWGEIFDRHVGELLFALMDSMRG